MLNEFLKVAYEKSAAEKDKEEFVSLLMQLPMDELRGVVQTGEIKLANLCMDGENKSWVEQFKGTPFMEQAIGLEQELLQAEMANQQRNSVESQRSQQAYAQLDQIRLKKRLLELQKARGEMGTLADVGIPVSGNLPQDMSMSAPTSDKTASRARVKYPILKLMGAASGVGAATGALGGALNASKYKKEHQKNPSSTTLAFAAKHPKSFGAAVGGASGASMPLILGSGQIGGEIKELSKELKHHGGKAIKRLRARGEVARQHVQEVTKKKPSEKANKAVDDLLSKLPKPNKSPKSKDKSASADLVGRMLARHDMEKMAHQQDLLEVGDRAGKILAKHAGLGDSMLRIATNNPGMIAGGAIGAIHGLTRDDGGVAAAVGEGLGGAALGHAAQGIGGRLYRGHKAEKAIGKNIEDAVSGYGNQLKNEGRILGKGLQGMSGPSEEATQRLERLRSSRNSAPIPPAPGPTS